MRKIWYVGLEKYIGRYTYQLQEWTERAYKARGINYEIVEGDVLDVSEAIQVGQVLDAHGRTYYSMSQMMYLVKAMREGRVSGKDVIFFEDMFTSGIESLGYIMNQIPEQDRPKIFVRCLAQTVDPDDFVHVWQMSKWMNRYEAMVNEMPNVHVLATNEEMIANMKVAGWTAPLYNISGLSFGKEEVQERIPTQIPKPWEERSDRVVFAARWDQEKQPDFFMDLVERVTNAHPYIEFALLQGGPLRSNNSHYIHRARELSDAGKLTIHENLDKNSYYEFLDDSKVLFNCALQDWVSNTVSEADALGCNVLYPAYRSFPETFANDADRLYVPWSLDDAYDKLLKLLIRPHKDIGRISDWTDGTIDRMLDIMTNPVQEREWNRDNMRYRDRTSESKY